MTKLPKLEFVTWHQFHQLCFGLAEDLEKSHLSLDTIVSISRGGHVISRILSDLLGLSIFNVSIESYKSLKQTDIKLTQKLGQYLHGQNVLLVDEVVDSGKTLKRAVSYLHKLRCSSQVSCCLHVKPQAVLKPDFYVTETSSWVIYPYEVRETINSLLPIWQNHNLSKSHLLTQLVKGGLDRHMVGKFLK